MKFGDSFYQYCEKHKLGKTTVCFETKEKYFEVSKREFHKLNKLGGVFNGTEGGLILGNLHTAGGIHLLMPVYKKRFFKEITIFRYMGEMEGWEYLTSPIKNRPAIEALQKINDTTRHTDSASKTDFVIPKNCKVVDTSSTRIAILLLSKYTHLIINRTATKRHIDEIIKLDLVNKS